jgi:hypothetical protein
MFRRLPLSALTALALLGAFAPAPARAAPAAPAKAAPATSYTVWYRGPGHTAWTQQGTYPSHERAMAVAQDLYRRGFEVQVQPRTSITHLPPRPRSADLPAHLTVTPQQAAQIFRWMAGQQDIAFRYVADGCYARCHLMVQRMLAHGWKPYKVWSFENGEPLYVKTDYHSGGHVTWRYHVAPILRVRMSNGQQAWRVIDPSMFPEPVSIARWSGAQKRRGSRYSPYVTVTRLGQAPVDVHGKRLAGSGYWTGADPPGGLGAHARQTMRRYKALEPLPRPRRTLAHAA